MKHFLILFTVTVPVWGLILLFKIFVPTVHAAEVSGVITSDTTWTLVNSPYIVTDTIDIQSGITLTIEAGVEVKIASADYIFVYGHLEAQGMPTKPITFTSISNNGADEWNSLYISLMGNANFKNVVIQHSSSGVRVHTGGRVILEDSILKNNLSYPVEVSSPSLNHLAMTNTVFANNGYNRIQVHAYTGFETLTDSTTLGPQPGLEGYELFLDHDFIIPNGVTLTLEAGTTLMAPPDAFINIYGHLDVQGTVSQPVTLTSVANSGPGEWGSLYINSTGSAKFNGAVIQYSSYGIRAHNNSSNAQVSFEDSILKDNLTYPLETHLSALHNLVLTNTVFANNGHDRTLIYTYGSLSGDSELRSQLGLEGYEIIGGSDFIVPEGITVSLESGVTMVISGNNSLQVNGRFIANGTQINPVNITSSNDTAPGEWGGISVNGGEVVLNHTNLRNGEVNLALTSPTSTVTISNSTVISASQSGISVTGGLLNMECSVLSGNGIGGLWVGSGGTPDVTINRTDIWGNGSAGITSTNSTFIDARYNWWGASDGPGGDFSGSGDPAFGNILHSPWLSTPNDCAEPPFRVFLPMILAPDD